MTGPETFNIASRVVAVVVALGGAVALGWGGSSWFRSEIDRHLVDSETLKSEIDKALRASEIQNQLIYLLEFTDKLAQPQNQESVSLSEDGRRILEALVANSKGIGFGVAVYPFESVVRKLGMRDVIAGTAIAELQEHDFVELADEEVQSPLSGETTTYPVYRVTADGFRWIRDAGRNP